MRREEGIRGYVREWEKGGGEGEGGTFFGGPVAERYGECGCGEGGIECWVRMVMMMI